MLENLFNLVKEHAGEAIINNPAIPNERNDEAINTASNSILDGIKNAIAGGNVNDVMHMFQSGGNAASTSLGQNIQGNFIQDLMNKFNLNQSQAGGIANNLLPDILNKFVHKTNDPNDNSFNIQNIIQHVSGGQGEFDIQGILSKFQTAGNGGGLMDTVKGLFS